MPTLLHWASVRENIALGLRFQGHTRRDPKAVGARIDALLDQIGLADRGGAPPAELPGGRAASRTMSPCAATLSPATAPACRCSLPPDPDFVARDLYDDRFVKAALTQYPGWVEDTSADRSSPFTREEVLRL